MEDSKPDKNSQNAKIKISMNNRGTKLSREADLSSDVPAIFKKKKRSSGSRENLPPRIKMSGSSLIRWSVSGPKQKADGPATL